MGTILNTKFSRRALASGVLLTKKSIHPFIIQEAFDSPGWTLADKNTPCLAFDFALFGSLSLDVIVRNSVLLPAKVLQRVERVKIP